MRESAQSPSHSRARRARRSAVTEWVEEEFTESDEEVALLSSDKEVLDTFKDCFSKLSGSTSKFTPMNSRLRIPLSDTTKSTKEKCIAKASEACRMFAK